MAGYAIYLLCNIIPQKLFETSSEEEKKEKKKQISYKTEKEFCKINGTIFKYTGNFNLRLTNKSVGISVENILNTDDLNSLNYCINRINPLPDQYVDVNVDTAKHKLLTLNLLTEEEKRRKLVWAHQLEQVEYELYFTMAKNQHDEISNKSEI
ncbi:hypothetical protein SNEBB_000426 [Seison nebaliae]|nr:hypothetical protein SNEBB_000426 [Seison nebaliae]